MNNFHVESCASMVRLVRIARFQFSLWRIFRHQHPYSDQILSWQVKVAWHIVPVDRICTVAAQSFDNCWLQHPEGDKTLRIMTVFQAISLPPSMNFLATGSLCLNWHRGFPPDCIQVLLAKQSYHVYISFKSWRFAMPWSLRLWIWNFDALCSPMHLFNKAVSKIHSQICWPRFFPYSSRMCTGLSIVFWSFRLCQKCFKFIRNAWTTRLRSRLRIE